MVEVEGGAGGGGIDLKTILDNIFEAIKIVINKIAETLKDNAETIGTLLVLGAVTLGIVTYGRRIFGHISGFLRGFM